MGENTEKDAFSEQRKDRTIGEYKFFLQKGCIFRKDGLQ